MSFVLGSVFLFPKDSGDSDVSWFSCVKIRHFLSCQADNLDDRT